MGTQQVPQSPRCRVHCRCDANVWRSRGARKPYSSEGPSLRRRSRAIDGHLRPWRHAIIVLSPSVTYQTLNGNFLTGALRKVLATTGKPKWRFFDCVDRLANRHHELQCEISILRLIPLVGFAQVIFRSSINIAELKAWAFSRYAGTLRRQGERFCGRYRGSSVAP